MRKCLDKTIKADQCAQYVDDIGIAANYAEELINNLRATFQCIQKGGLKLGMHKCHFDATEIHFMGRAITHASLKPQRPRLKNSLENKKLPKSKKGLERYLGLLIYYQNNIRRLSENIAVLFKMLTKDEKILVTPDLLEQFTKINKGLHRCCELALKQPQPNKQIALMTDASFSAAGYAVHIEDDLLEKRTSTTQLFASRTYGSNSFSPTQNVHIRECILCNFL